MYVVFDPPSPHPSPYNRILFRVLLPSSTQTVKDRTGVCYRIQNDKIGYSYTPTVCFMEE